MKKFSIFMIVLILFFGCSSQSGKFGFTSGDCNKIYEECLQKCNKTRDECNRDCEKLKGMCRAMKIKGCMQECNQKYGKGTPAAEDCKAKCENIN